MKGAGAFKAYSRLMVQVGAVAQDHGAQHTRVGVTEEQPVGQSRCAGGGGKVDQALASGLLHGMKPAGKASMPVPFPQGDGSNLERAHCADILLPQPRGSIPHTRIQITLG